MPQTVDLPLDKSSGEEGSTKNISTKESNTDSSLHALLGKLSQKLGVYISKRFEKEQEWILAEQQYDGMHETSDRTDKKLAAMSGPVNINNPAVNITRPKTNIQVARLQDIQFPDGLQYNFSVRPTPVPELDELKKDTRPMAGMPDAPTIGDAASKAMDRAKDMAYRMETAIQDRLVESDFAKRSRLAMEQMGRLGTGVLKAPVMSFKRNKKYASLSDSEGNPVRVLEYATDTVPTVQWVDIRMWFPDPSARPGTSILDSFELHSMTKTELAELAHNPAFMENRIRDVLREEPQPGQLAKAHLLSLMGNASDALDTRYAVMEYRGPMDKEVLFELDLIEEKQKNDPLVNIQGEVWFVNNQIIRVSVEVVEGEEHIPYHVCTWEDDQNSVFGHGIPHLMRHAQRVINSSWMMLLDNAGLTAGPQVVLNREMIQPANPSEGWTIAPMKVWFMTEYGANVQEAMQFVNVPTQQESISNIIELSLHFADLESSTPQILQGETPAGNNTFGGIAMIMTASHIIQKRISEKWDDNINVPIVQRLYHYEMQYGEDDSLKGDYEVMAGGATARIDKQIRAQDLERIMGMAGSNEQFMQHIDIGMAFREWVATTRVGDILKPIDQVIAEQQQAAQNQPPDPALIEAEARAKQADAAIAKIELDREMKDIEFQLRAKIEEAKVDKENREIVAREQENQIKLQIAQLQREDQMIRLAAEQQLSLAQFANNMEIAVLDAETKRLLKAADIDKFNTEIRIKEATGRGI